jgi:hypothetical protein
MEGDCFDFFILPKIFGNNPNEIFFARQDKNFVRDQTHWLIPIRGPLLRLNA